MLIRWGNVAAAIGTVRASASAQPAVNLAFEFLVLTAARSGKVRLATWEGPHSALRLLDKGEAVAASFHVCQGLGRIEGHTVLDLGQEVPQGGAGAGSPWATGAPKVAPTRGSASRPTGRAAPWW